MSAPRPSLFFVPPLGGPPPPTVTLLSSRYESYEGINVRLRYFLRVSVMRNYSGKLVHEETFRVQVGSLRSSAAPIPPKAFTNLCSGRQRSQHWGQRGPARNPGGLRRQPATKGPGGA